MALLPSAATAKKSPHRVFRQTRSKAAKSSDDVPSPPFYDPDLEPSVDSKAAKSQSKTFKEVFPKAGKVGKTSKSCIEDDYLGDFDLMLDLSSLSMSMSMSLSMPFSGKSGKASSAKCSKYDGAFPDSMDDQMPQLTCVGDVDIPGAMFPLCPGLDFGEYCDGTGDCDSEFCACDAGRKFCDTHTNPCLVVRGDDDWFGDDDYYNEVTVKEIIVWTMEMLTQCAGASPLDYDSCLVENIVDVLAGSAFDDTDDSTARMLRGAGRKMQANTMHDDWYKCEIPDEADIEAVVDEALNLCVDAGRVVQTNEHETVLRSLTSVFTNETCVCGMF